MIIPENSGKTPPIGIDVPPDMRYAIKKALKHALDCMNGIRKGDGDAKMLYAEALASLQSADMMRTFHETLNEYLKEQCNSTRATLERVWKKQFPGIQPPAD